jgi:magnesium transporter
MERTSVTRVEADDRLVFVHLPLPAAATYPQEASLTVVCLPTTLVTIHTQPFPSLARLPAKLMHQRHRAALTLSALLLHILSQCIEEDVHDYLALREMTTRLTAQLDQTPDVVEGKTILDLKRQVNHLAHTCENQLFVTMTLTTIDSPAFSVRHLRKSADSVVKGVRHCQRGVTRLEAQVQDLQQHYVLMVQQATNHRLRLLTIMSAVFMPLTLITGIYGMNFAHMPELASPAAYPIVLGMMLVIALLLLGFFYRNGWFE